MAVGALEPHFYSQLLIGLNLDPEDENHSQMNMTEMKSKFEKLFKTKTQKQWIEIFDKLDACCTPVLSWDTAHEHEHNKQRKNFFTDANSSKPTFPAPAPRFSASKMPDINRPLPDSGQNTIEILQEIGYSQEQVEHLLKNKIVHQKAGAKSKL